MFGLALASIRLPVFHISSNPSDNNITEGGNFPQHKNSPSSVEVGFAVENTHVFHCVYTTVGIVYTILGRVAAYLACHIEATSAASLY